MANKHTWIFYVINIGFALYWLSIHVKTTKTRSRFCFIVSSLNDKMTQRDFDVGWQKVPFSPLIFNGNFVSQRKQNIFSFCLKIRWMALPLACFEERRKVQARQKLFLKLSKIWILMQWNFVLWTQCQRQKKTFRREKNSIDIFILLQHLFTWNILS